MSVAFRNDEGSASDGPLGGAGSQFRSPLYHQIFLVLRQRILDGVVTSGEKLPGEQELAELFGVSRITAKRALDELAASGLVVRERGRGTRVVERQTPVYQTPAAHGNLAPLLEMGETTQVSVLECDFVSADRAVSKALGLGEGWVVQRAVRVRSVGGEPFSHLTTFVPEEIGRTFGRGDLSAHSMLSLLERAGAEPTRAEQIVSATLADAEVASHLALEIGAPLLRVVRTVFDASDRAVEHLSALYRPDRFHLSMRLDRAEGMSPEHWTTESVKGTASTDGGRPR